MSKLDFNNITKTYPSGVCAVKNFNLSVDEGELIVLFGPTESAKSTLIRMVAGLEDVTDGSILLDNKILNDMSTKDREVAFISQNFTLFPQMSVFDNIAYGLRLRKVPEEVITDKVNVTAEVLGLKDCLNKKTKLLTTIQKQRVAFGRAIVREPKVFLFDEPYSNLDANSRMAMRTEIIKLHKRLNSTIIFATKDPIEALTLADRLVVLNQGFIMQVDSPKNVYNYPSNFFTAALIGNPQMNMITGYLSKTESGFWACFGKRKIKVSDKTAERIIDKEKLAETTEVSFGIRYEDTKCVNSSELKEVSQYCVDCIVKAIETVGDENQIFCAVGEDEKDADTMIIKASADRQIKNKDRIDVYCDTDYLQIFNITTGEPMLSRDEGFVIDEKHTDTQNFVPLNPEQMKDALSKKKLVVEESEAKEEVKNSLNAKYEEKQAEKKTEEK